MSFSSQYKFSSIFCAKFHVQTSGWTECFKQVHRHYLILDSNQIPLNFLLHFSFHILKFVPIYTCAVVKEFCKLQEKESLGFLCQPIDRVYICFEMTDIKVISAPLSLRKFDFSQHFCSFGAVLKCLLPLCISSRTENLSRGFVHIKLYIRLISASNDTCCRQMF